MVNRKASAVTVIVFTLAAIVAAFVFRSFRGLFMVIEGVFAVFGFIKFGEVFYRWLVSPAKKRAAHSHRKGVTE